MYVEYINQKLIYWSYLKWIYSGTKKYCKNPDGYLKNYKVK